MNKKENNLMSCHWLTHEKRTRENEIKEEIFLNANYRPLPEDSIKLLQFSLLKDNFFSDRFTIDQ